MAADDASKFVASALAPVTAALTLDSAVNLQVFCSPPERRAALAAAWVTVPGLDGEQQQRPLLHAVCAVTWPVRGPLLSADALAAERLLELELGEAADVDRMRAAERRVAVLACWLLRGGADPLQRGGRACSLKTAPMAAAAAGNLAVAELLVLATGRLHGKEAQTRLLEARDVHGNTLMHYVAAHANGAPTFLRLALPERPGQAAADCAAKNLAGETAALLLIASMQAQRNA